MPLQATGASGPAPSRQAIRIDLAKLLGFESFSELKVEIVKRGYVSAALAELSAMQPAAELPGILIAARTAANVGPAPASLAAITQAVAATTTAHFAASALSDVRTATVSLAITQATAATMAASSPASAAQVAALATQNALQQTVTAPSAAVLAARVISAGRPAAATSSTQRSVGTRLAVTTPSEAQLSAAQRTT